jgi:hypothetical protein
MKEIFIAMNMDYCYFLCSGKLDITSNPENEFKVGRVPMIESKDTSGMITLCYIQDISFSILISEGETVHFELIKVPSLTSQGETIVNLLENIDTGKLPTNTKVICNFDMCQRTYNCPDYSVEFYWREHQGRYLVYNPVVRIINIDLIK